MISDILDWMQALPEWGLAMASLLLGFVEGIVGVGVLIPFQPGLVVGAAVTSVADFLLLWAALTAGGIGGNLVGFELGRRVGPALRESRLVRGRGAERWDRVTEMIRRRGAWAVFAGRLIMLLQSFVPPVAGAAGMSYRAFLPPLALGAACSQALGLLVGVGAFAGLSAGGAAAAAVIAVPVTVAIVILVRRRRAVRV